MGSPVGPPEPLVWVGPSLPASRTSLPVYPRFCPAIICPLILASLVIGLNPILALVNYPLHTPPTCIHLSLCLVCINLQGAYLTGSTLNILWLRFYVNFVVLKNILTGSELEGFGFFRIYLSEKDPPPAKSLLENTIENPFLKFLK